MSSVLYDTKEASIVLLKDINKTYRLGETIVKAIQGVSLAIQKGEFTALVGASGSGKTTLLNIIGCIDEPDSGQVLIDGIDVINISDTQKSLIRNKKIAFIFQTFNLIPVLDVFENVELPLLLNPKLNRDIRRHKVSKVLEEVGIYQYRNHRPDQLSGGQRQRVAIARALVTDPVLVLADEPTANLDSTNSHKIIDIMLELNANKQVTFLFSTHDDKLISRVFRKIYIKDGVLL